MTAALEALADALAAESRGLHGLLGLLEEEGQVLLRGDAAALAALADRKAAQIRDNAALEDARRRALAGIAEVLHVAPSTLTLTEVARRAPAQARTLLARRDELRRLAQGLADRARHNGFLIDRSLEYLRGLLSSLVGAVTRPATYTASGRHASPAAAALIDRQA
jgi:flagellar biosynthesis/type III secretory pathway chaperone